MVGSDPKVYYLKRPIPGLMRLIQTQTTPKGHDKKKKKKQAMGETAVFGKLKDTDCGVLNEKRTPQSQVFEHLVPSWSSNCV